MGGGGGVRKPTTYPTVSLIYFRCVSPNFQACHLLIAVEKKELQFITWHSYTFYLQLVGLGGILRSARSVKQEILLLLFGNLGFASCFEEKIVVGILGRLVFISFCFLWQWPNCLCHCVWIYIEYMYLRVCIRLVTRNIYLALWGW